MKSIKLTLILASTIFMSNFSTFVKPAQANFGNFMLGVGAGVGTSAIIRNNQRAAEERYRPVSPDAEFFRGRQDGINGLRYDNPRNSIDYDRGFQEGLRLRQGGR
ncbi:MAG: hypothetical protein GW795_15310 [Cyanobacteria bacterium]|uniref:hypothetical protein n=1 Tax=Geminocystis sp. TaxID=2664100 RepID=UPI001D3C3915|nr:hypothetical protein [Cyanobacteria bacterium CG_2015-16_32_12]NCO77028.1 hypothetical protein [Cyanobacteria bacterium CG_2015-22_32_23]NCQ04663.1 hypothetical protein [Cyanobacteria bacterium CG_2015-09_32_10]NCQ43194.1 hypothetical protein [Cyanobacteria bacterium CG_2015-04_32_10]NCS85225.1 hypothetical protein [Cyanobacteria bacterium CG_2015-02_32_10]